MVNFLEILEVLVGYSLEYLQLLSIQTQLQTGVVAPCGLVLVQRVVKLHALDLVVLQETLGPWYGSQVLLLLLEQLAILKVLHVAYLYHGVSYLVVLRLLLIKRRLLRSWLQVHHIWPIINGLLGVETHTGGL